MLIKSIEDFEKKYQRKITLNNFETNELHVGKNVIIKGTVIFNFRGNSKGNRIVIGDNVELHNVDIGVNGRNCLVEIGGKCKWKGNLICHGKESKLEIGSGSTSIESFIVARDGSVKIGKNCLFSRNVEIRTSDSHKIYEKNTREQINIPSNVDIGDHVWIAANSVVSKGASIPNESVVGAMSFVNKKFDESNVILAGAPAKIIKRGIDWER